MKSFLILLLLIFLSYSCEQKREEKKDNPNNQTVESDLQKIVGNIPLSKQQISIPSGEYFATNEKLDDYGISLKIDKDSIIYTESEIWGKCIINTCLNKLRLLMEKYF